MRISVGWSMTHLNSWAPDLSPCGERLTRWVTQTQKVGDSNPLDVHPDARSLLTPAGPDLLSRRILIRATERRNRGQPAYVRSNLSIGGEEGGSQREDSCGDVSAGVNE